MALIYIVEDDINIREIERYALKNSGFEVEEFDNGKDFFQRVSEQAPSLMLLDIMLPGEDGLEILSRVRKNPATEKTPVIMVTAKTTEIDKVKGLDSGADDYLTKPFSMKELLARIRAMTRRKADTTDSVLTFGDITLDRSTYMLTGPASIKNAGSIENNALHTDANNEDNGNLTGKIKGDNTSDGQVSGNQNAGNPSIGTQNVGIRLANKEYQMLEMLMTNPGQIISADQFMDRIWGYDSEAEQNVVWVYISYLRKKLASVGSAAQIKATRGVGYSII